MLLDGYILGIIGPVTTPMKEDLGMSTWELGLVAHVNSQYSWQVSPLTIINLMLTDPSP